MNSRMRRAESTILGLVVGSDPSSNSALPGLRNDLDSLMLWVAPLVLSAKTITQSHLQNALFVQPLRYAQNFILGW